MVRRGPSLAAWRQAVVSCRALLWVIVLAFAFIGGAAATGLPTMTASDCAGAHADGHHGRAAESARHAETCCVFHCAPAVPLMSALFERPAAAGARIPPAVEAAVRGVTLPILVPPPRG